MTNHTWIALLVIGGCASEADAPAHDATSRMGVDYSWDRPSPPGLVAAGYTFAVRYVSFDGTGKNLTAGEASALRAAGIDISVVWESNARDALDGLGGGVRDATEAARLAAAAGLPGDRPIYFAIDFNAGEAEQPAIDAYFDGVASVIAGPRIGAYGGYGPVKRLFDAGKIRWGWQTLAWSDGQWESRAQLRQIQNDVTLAGGACDIDQAMTADFGQWGGDVPPVTGVGDASDACTQTEIDHARLNGVNDWTCQDSARYVCDERGNKVIEACPSGCVSAGVGADDQCLAGGGPSCTVAEITNQTGPGAALPSLWTCQGSARYVCDGRGFKVTQACANGCQGEGFGHDDQCL
jgi:glycoside hydrolase-like protein